jgi:drug/metabolite transporter (DMT)-like permease
MTEPARLLKTQALPYLLLTGFLFGSGLLSARLAINQFDVLTYSGFRLVLASLGYVGLYRLNRQRYPWPTNPRVWRQGILLGLMNEAVPMVAGIGSLQYLSSGVASIFFTTGPAITVLLAHFFLADEILTRRQTVGVVITLAGALLLAMRGETGLPDIRQANPLGYTMIMVAVLSLSLSAIYIRKFMRQVSSFDLAGIQTFAAAGWVLPITIFSGAGHLDGVNWQGYTALVYGVVFSSLMGALIYFYTIQRFGATLSALSHYVTPVVVTLGGVLLLGEQITFTILAGIVLVGLGIGLVNRHKQPGSPEAIYP